MIEANFYILNDNNQETLIEKALELILENYSKNNKILVLASSQISKEIDVRLWKNNQEDFIPHFCAIEMSDYDKFDKSPIIITDNIFISRDRNILINLTNTPIDLSRDNKNDFRNIIEITNQDNTRLDSTRKKYIIYKKNQLKLNHFKL